MQDLEKIEVLKSAKNIVILGLSPKKSKASIKKLNLV